MEIIEAKQEFESDNIGFMLIKKPSNVHQTGFHNTCGIIQIKMTVVDSD